MQLIVDNPLRQNRMLTGPQAFELGLADRLLEPVELLDESLEELVRIVEEGRGKREPDADLDDAAEVCAKARARVDDQVHGAAPAPYRALELIEGAATWTIEEGYRAEEDALADLLPGPRGTGVRLRVRRRRAPPQARRRRSGSGAAEVQRVGIVGAGLMATQLATLFLRRLEVPVVLTDVDPARVEQAVPRSARSWRSSSRAGGCGAEGALPGRRSLSRATGLDAYAGCDLVLEAVFEELAVKQQVLGALEDVVGETCLLATNTSSLSVTEMGARAAPSGARRRAALLQPGRRAAARRGGAHAGDRRRLAGDRLGRDAGGSGSAAFSSPTRPPSSSTAC